MTEIIKEIVFCSVFFFGKKEWEYKAMVIFALYL